MLMVIFAKFGIAIVTKLANRLDKKQGNSSNKNNFELSPIYLE